jgi:hypothetical protein
MMKVEDTRKSGLSGVKRSKGVSKGTNRDFGSLLVSDSKLESVSSSGRISAVDSIVSIQEISVESDGKNNAQKRASKMLEKLEDIRVGLLLGEIPRSNLEELSKVVRSTREESIDSNLSEILDDIELRARIELAKLDINN